MDTYHNIFYHGQQHLVNSYHTLCLEQAPPGATVLAHDPDGYAEAWILGRTAGIQWHPERMVLPWIPTEIQHLLS
jgi:gamma-glutamyl-gamma-aminobutyrate hydrolase PuuD